MTDKLWDKLNNIGDLSCEFSIFAEEYALIVMTVIVIAVLMVITLLLLNTENSYLTEFSSAVNSCLVRFNNR